MHPRYPRLFEPLTLRNVALRNRIVVSGHFAGWWVDHGLPSDRFVRYVEERAKGGVGLFVIGATSPMPGSGWITNTSDAIVPRYQAVADAGHRHGMKVFAQLCHPGFKPLPGTPIIGSAPRAATPFVHGNPLPQQRHIPSIGELETLAQAFGAAAGRAVRGGVDGIELHAHESFLHAQFLTPLWNTRTDHYGGSPENRLRFVVETLQAMRDSAGDVPLGIRVKCHDGEQAGLDHDGFRDIVLRLEATGLVDYVILTGGDGRYHHGPTPRPEAEWLPDVSRIRQSTKLPALYAGRIVTAEQAENAITSGAVDAVCMTKAHICDPHHAAKAESGRENEIRVCTRCLQSCHGAMERMTCVYNPVTSREAEPGWTDLIPTQRKQRITVVGGGPAGCEFARVAAARGHDVMLLERESQLGGQVRIGARSPGREPWLRIAEYYERNLGSVDVRTGIDANPVQILETKPDLVVVATGSTPVRHELPGGPPVFNIPEALDGRLDTAKRVLVHDREGSNRALVTVDRLSSAGVDVVWATVLPEIRHTGDSMLLDEFLHRFRERGVVFAPGVEIAIGKSANQIVLRDIHTADETVLDTIDAVVMAGGQRSVADLAIPLRAAGVAVRVIGDAHLPQTVESAVFQAARLARLT